MSNVGDSLAARLAAAVDAGDGPAISSATKALLSSGASLDATLRVRVWSSLLGVPVDLNEEKISDEISNVPLGSGGRVIAADAARTRADAKEFANASARVERLLTHFVHTGHGGVGAVPYRQGLNEVLAGILFADMRMSDARASALLAHVVRIFAPRVYTTSGDAEMTSLQAMLALFRLQLLFFDPQLGKHLESFGVGPELYAVSYFLTLFCRGAAPDVFLPLWDVLFSCAHLPGAGLLHAIAVAFLISHRSTLLATRSHGTTAVELPVLLTSLSFRDTAHAKSVAGAALEIHRTTPLSFRVLTAAVAYSDSAHFTVEPSLLLQLEASLCVRIPIEELLAGSGVRHALPRRGIAHSGRPPAPAVAEKREALLEKGGLSLLLLDDAAWDATPRYLILDVRARSAADYGGRLPTAFNIDPKVLTDADALESALESFRGLRGVHFAVCGAGDLSAWHVPLPLDSCIRDFNGNVQDALGGDEPAAGFAQSTGFTMTDDQADTDARGLAMMLIQKGFERVATVAGGFAALHQTQAHFLDTVLVGHEPGFCLNCGASSELLAAQEAVDEAATPRARALPAGRTSPAPPPTFVSPGSAPNRTRPIRTLGDLLDSSSSSSTGTGAGAGGGVGVRARAESWLAAGAGALLGTLAIIAEPPPPSTPHAIQTPKAASARL